MPSYDLWKHPTSGRWYITWTEQGGRSRRATTGTKDRSAAELARAAFALDHGRAKHCEPHEVRIADALDIYYHRHAHKLPSAEAARYAIAHLKTFYGSSTVAVITDASNTLYLERSLAEGLAVGTINRRRMFLRAALNHAKRRNELTEAPFIPLEPEPPPRPHFLTRDQAAKVLQAARHLPHISLFIRLALCTGARHSALLELTWDRVDFDTRTLDYRVPGRRYTRKKRADAAPLPAKMVSTLRRARRKAKTGYVIEWRGQPVKSVKKAFRGLAKATKLPWLTPHILKHTFVTWALARVDAWTVQGITATSARTLQSVYGKHMPGNMRAAAEILAHNRPRNSPRKSDVVQEKE